MKKTILMILVVTLLAIVFSACSGTAPGTVSTNTIGTSSGTVGSSPDSTEQSTGETVTTGYVPGKWTINGYTSQWLNLSFSKGNKFKTTNESIEITKEFNEVKKQNDSYAEIIEMQFEWLDGTGTPIMLVVEPLKDKALTVKNCVDEEYKELQSSYEMFKIEVVDRSEKEVTFLGETYLQSYEKTSSFGKTHERYMLCRIKDGHLIQISFYAEESKMDIESFLSCFSALDGSGQ